MSLDLSLRSTPQRRRFLLLALLWAVAFVVSVIWFSITYKSLPDIGTVIMSLTLLAPFAITLSFLELFSQVSSGVLFENRQIILPLYWVVLLTLQVSYIKFGHRVLLGVSAVIIAMSAPYWTIVGAGLLGI